MNDFHIYEEIGQGRHSTVYKGRKKASITYVAIKSVDKKQMDKVLREVKIIYRLKHANILRFHNWYETRNHLWLILEYCTGGDLLHVLTQDRQLPESTVKVLGVDLLSGLQHLHHSGILYCDLKPSNVLIDEYGVLKLCDFGLARSIPTNEDDVQATKRGTPCYMAPELFTDDGVYSCASDLWALGCILYEMVVGVPPFVSNSFEELVSMVLTAPVPKPAIGNDGTVVRLSKSLRHLLEGLLTKVPSERMQWEELLQHPFWNARPTPLKVDIPPQPLFEASVIKFQTERRRSVERKQRERTSSKLRTRGTGATGSDSVSVAHADQRQGGGNRNGAPHGDEAVAAEHDSYYTSSSDQEDMHKSSDQSNTMRMSRIARENLDRNRLRDTYGANSSSFHEENYAKGVGGGDNGRNSLNLELPDVDAELDFDEKSSPVSMPGKEQHAIISGSSMSNNAAVMPMGALPGGSSMSISSSPSMIKERERYSSDGGGVDDGEEDGKEEGDGNDDDDEEEEELHPSPMRRRRETPTTPTADDVQHRSGAGATMGNDERRAQSARPAPRSDQRGHRERQDHNAFRHPSSTSKMTSNTLLQQRSASPSSLNSPTSTAWEYDETPSSANMAPASTSRTTNTAPPFVLPVHSLTSHSEIVRMLSSVPSKQVSPISGNDAIERTSPLRYNATTLSKRLTPLSIQDVARMEQQRLEEFLTRLYHALDDSKATVLERVHVLGYFSTLCGVASVANQLVNSSLMSLLVKMLKKHSSVPNILCGINHVLAKLFRHATYISDDLSSDGMLVALVKCVGGRDRKVRRRAMGALGELLFYVTTEEDGGNNRDGSKSSGSEESGWIIPGSVVPLLRRCLKSEDSVLAHYACKTLQNIYTQGTTSHLSRFVSVEITKILMDIACRGTGSGSHRNGGGGFERTRGVKSIDANASGGLRATAIRAIAQLVLHQHQGTYDCTDVLQGCLSEDSLSTLLEGMSDTRSRSLTSFLDVINYVLIHSTGIRRMLDNNINTGSDGGYGKSGAGTNQRPHTGGVGVSRRRRGRSRAHVDGEPLRALSARILQHARFLPCVLHIMEHASSAECRGRSLVTLHIAVANDVAVLSQACRRRLMSVIDRMFKLVDPKGRMEQQPSTSAANTTKKKSSFQQDRVGIKYLGACLRTTCRFLVHAAVSQVASSVTKSERDLTLHQDAASSSSTSAAGGGTPPSMRSPTLMRELAKTTTNAERTFPTLLQLLNSTYLTRFFHDVDVVRIVAKHVRIATSVGRAGTSSDQRQTAVRCCIFLF